MSDKELRNKYRGLSKIEETFKITKSELDARPVLVWIIEHDLCLQNYTDEIIEEFQKIFNIDFSRKYLTLLEIKKNFSI